MSSLRHLFVWLSVLSLTAWTGSALAAEGEKSLERTEGTLSPSEFEKAMEGLSEEEKEAMDQAYREVALGEVPEKPAFEGAEKAGIIVMGPGNLPNPDERAGIIVQGPPGESAPELNEQEKALMEKVEGLEKSLATEGKSPEQIHEAIEKEFGAELREAGVGKELEQGKEDSERELPMPVVETEKPETLEKHSETTTHETESAGKPEAQEKPSYEAPEKGAPQPTSEHEGREHGGYTESR